MLNSARFSVYTFNYTLYISPLIALAIYKVKASTLGQKCVVVVLSSLLLMKMKWAWCSPPPLVPGGIPSLRRTPRKAGRDTRAGGEKQDQQLNVAGGRCHKTTWLSMQPNSILPLGEKKIHHSNTETGFPSIQRQPTAGEASAPLSHNNLPSVQCSHTAQNR